MSNWLLIEKTKGVSRLLNHNKLIAHRGASAYAPENTFAAFERALDFGIKAIEFDVMLSSDNQAFVFHDNSLKRTSNGKGKIGLVSGGYLQTLDAGSWFSSRFSGEKIPLFEDVLNWALIHDVFLNIEIKPYPGTVEQTTITVLSLINQYWPHNKPLPLVSCFEKDALSLCRTISPEQPLGYLIDDWDLSCLEQAKALNCYSIHINYQVLTKKRIDQIKEAGFHLLAYTVNKQGMARKLLDCGVDAIFSDYPDLLVY